MYQKFGKRWLDISAATCLIVLLSPLLIVLSILAGIIHKGSPFFIQKRVGYQEKIFPIIKFKTMMVRTDPDGTLLPDALRLTSLGRFLRKTSLDELPQLWNVVAGDMSLIGPRPLLIDYLPLYNSEQRQRHQVKPGITGWAQVNGRNALSWKDKFNFDLWYVKHLSPTLDLKITMMTIRLLLRPKGINNMQPDQVEPFRG